MYRFEYKAYRRHFANRFANARESYATRDGLALRLEDQDGRVGFGESAPLESFGTESFVSTLAAATALGDTLRSDASFEPELCRTPALRWGIESAMDMIEREGDSPKLENPWPVCGLVSDIHNLDEVCEKLNFHYRCLKFKIGKGAFLDERRALDRVLDVVDAAVSVRLDANASLDVKQTVAWLETLADQPVEYLEQPMPVGAEREMARLAEDFPTSLALDESVRGVDDLKRWRDAQWPGIFVIKPSLAGSLRELRDELANGACDCVYSSALESAFGVRSGLVVALEHPARRRALGFGVESLFGDRKLGLELGSFLQPAALPTMDTLQTLWNQI